MSALLALSPGSGFRRGFRLRLTAMACITRHAQLALGKIPIDLLRHRDHVARDFLFRIFVARVISLHVAIDALHAEPDSERTHDLPDFRASRRKLEHLQVGGNRQRRLRLFFLRVQSEQRKQSEQKTHREYDTNSDWCRALRRERRRDRSPPGSQAHEQIYRACPCRPAPGRSTGDRKYWRAPRPRIDPSGSYANSATPAFRAAPHSPDAAVRTGLVHSPYRRANRRPCSWHRP